VNYSFILQENKENQLKSSLLLNIEVCSLQGTIVNQKCHFFLRFFLPDLLCLQSLSTLNTQVLWLHVYTVFRHIYIYKVVISVCLFVCLCAKSLLDPLTDSLQILIMELDRTTEIFLPWFLNSRFSGLTFKAKV